MVAVLLLLDFLFSDKPTFVQNHLLITCCISSGSSSLGGKFNWKTLTNEPRRETI